MSTIPNTEHEDQGADADVATAQAPTLSPLDRSMRAPRPRPTYSQPPTVFDIPNPTTAPSPLLHPGNVTSMDGYMDDGSMPDAVVSAVHAFTALHDAEARTIAARVELRSNEALSPGDQVISLADLQSKLQTAATKKADHALALLKASIDADAKALSQPLRTSATAPFGAEVRATLRSMSTEARMQALSAAIAEGNIDIAGPALGAPALLSGLDAGMVQALTEHFNRVRAPQTVARLEMLRTIEDRLVKAGSHIVANYERTLGISQGVVNRMRAKKASAAKVLA